MQNAFRLLLGLALATSLSAQRDIGTVNVNADTQTTAISISSSSAELQNLALKAFGAHGRYRTVASGGAFALTFTPAGAAQVTVTITKGSAGTPVHSETLSGTSLRNALLRALPTSPSPRPAGCAVSSPAGWRSSARRRARPRSTPPTCFLVRPSAGPPTASRS
jgi:hypothetical protein